MSDNDRRDDDPSDLAGEYVLGVLDASEMARLAARRRVDPAFDRLVSEWERRLMPAISVIAAVAPPADLRERIEVEMALESPPVVRRLQRELWAWRGLSAASVVLACALFAVVWTRSGARPEDVTAMLAPGASGFVVRTRGDMVRLEPVHALSVSAGHDMELWSLPAGASVPHSLGVLPATGLTLRPGAVPPGTVQLLVSLEPTGGSPTGLPTGPVILSAMIGGARR